MKKIILLILLSIVFSNCSNRSADAKEYTKQIALEINDRFIEIAGNVNEIKDFAIEILLNPEKYKEGVYRDAEYEFFDNTIYYNPKKSDDEAIFLYTGFVPVGEKEKIKVKTMEHLAEKIKENYTSQSDYLNLMHITFVDSLLILYPYMELISYIPPKANMREGFTRSDKELNPLRKKVWSDIYIDMLGKGLVGTVTYPVYIEDEIVAFTGADINITAISNFISEKEEAILLVDNNSDDLKIISINTAGTEKTGLSNLAEWKYLEAISMQNAERRKGLDDLKLVNNESEEIKTLGKKLKSESEFEMEIKGEKYNIYRELIPECNWYIVVID